MKLKSLLLASGAALIAVSGARAADPVVIPEAEPVEYVRVCDAAGTGYFYIPGTETCLQISGEVIYKLNFRNTADDDDDADTVDDDDQDGWEKEYEISLDFSTWSDTEYGDLTTSIQLGASDATIDDGIESALSDAGVSVNEAFITLGGFIVGYTDSFYPGANGAADIDAEGPDTGLIGYSVDFGNGSFGIALEDDGNVDWVPAIAAIATASAGDISLAAAAVYDDTDEFWGAQVHASYSAGALSVDASAQYSDDGAGGFATSDYSAGYEWVLGLGADFDVSDQLTVFAGVDYGIDEFGTGDDDFLVEVGADFELVDGFNIGVAADFSDRTTGDFDFEDAELTFTVSF